MWSGTQIAAVQRTRCDVLVLDLQLRDGHGFNVLKVLRAPSHRPHVTIIVLTNLHLRRIAATAWRWVPTTSSTNCANANG